MNKKRPNLKNLFETLVNDNITTLKMVPTTSLSESFEYIPTRWLSAMQSLHLP